MPTKISAAADTGYELLTATDFIQWLEPGKHADLIDGEIFMHSPVSLRHAKLLNFLDALMRVYIDRYRLGELYREVVAVRLSTRNVFLPDLAFYHRDRGNPAQEHYVEGAPDLVVEALSRRTGYRDLGMKFAEYEQHGVREYWVLDPETLVHRFYRRNAEGILAEFAAEGDRIESQVISGFFVKRSWLDPGALPSLDSCISEVAGDSPRS